MKDYLEQTKKRTERERITDRQVTGVFSGSYAINPFTGEAVPIWISDYVLAGYGTGAIMAVPAHDSRDYAFAKHFNLPIVPLIEGCDVSKESFDAKEGIVCNSPRQGVTPYCDLSLNGLSVEEAIAATKKYVEAKKLGRVKVNYRLRDAIFSRQRYWGEPFPVYYKDCMPYMILRVFATPGPISILNRLLTAIRLWDTLNGGLGKLKNLLLRRISTIKQFLVELCTMPGLQARRHTICAMDRTTTRW